MWRCWGCTMNLGLGCAGYGDSWQHIRVMGLHEPDLANAGILLCIVVCRGGFWCDV